MTNNKVKENLPDMSWLNADNLKDKIIACKTWLEWYEAERKKDPEIYVKYIAQASSLKVILEMLQTIKQYSKNFN